MTCTCSPDWNWRHADPSPNLRGPTHMGECLMFSTGQEAVGIKREMPEERVEQLEAALAYIQKVPDYWLTITSVEASRVDWLSVATSMAESCRLALEEGWRPVVDSLEEVERGDLEREVRKTRAALEEMIDHAWSEKQRHQREGWREGEIAHEHVWRALVELKERIES